MSRLIFTPEMFEVERMATTGSGFKVDLNKYESAIKAQEIFDAWLEKQTVVYVTKDVEDYYASTEKTMNKTHKAYLVCIEEIKPCEHKRIETRYPLGSGGLNYTIEKFYCLDCNKQLKPKNGWEEIKD